MRSKYFLILILALLFGCDSDQEKKEALQTLEFNIDSTQVGKEVVNDSFNIKFRPPVGWEPLPQNIRDELLKKLAENSFGNAGTVYHPINILIDEKGQSFLYVSLVSIKGKPNLYEEQLKAYKEIILEEEKSFNPRLAEYLKGDLKISQLLIQKEGRVIFKILFSNGSNKVIQFDYILPQEIYSNKVKAVESSIGSITVLK